TFPGGKNVSAPPSFPFALFATARDQGSFTGWSQGYLAAKHGRKMASPWYASSALTHRFDKSAFSHLAGRHRHRICSNNRNPRCDECSRPCIFTKNDGSR